MYSGGSSARNGSLDVSFSQSPCDPISLKVVLHHGNTLPGMFIPYATKSGIPPVESVEIVKIFELGDGVLRWLEADAGQPLEIYCTIEPVAPIRMCARGRRLNKVRFGKTG
jgi:hypothetical protein